MRDLFAYGLRYAAQTWGYFFLLTDRYPNSDPAEPAADAPEEPRPVRLNVDDDLRRSRLTVFFRGLLYLPQLVWLILWGIAATVALIVKLVRHARDGAHPGRAASLPRRVRAVRRARDAYVTIVANPFPGFVGAPGTYPVEVEIDRPERQHRWKTLFRLFLALPAFLISGTLSWVLFLVAIFGWFVGLFLGTHAARASEPRRVRHPLLRRDERVLLPSDRRLSVQRAVGVRSASAGAPPPESEPAPAFT
jgi:hypothetical protein